MQTAINPHQPIGIYDSGVGGLSVLRAIRAALPHEDLLYLGDQANVPYGERTLEELRELARGVTRFMLAQGVKLIVIACNTASAAASMRISPANCRMPRGTTGIPITRGTIWRTGSRSSRAAA